MKNKENQSDIGVDQIGVKKSHKYDKKDLIISAIIGFLIGAIIMSAVFLLYNNMSGKNKMFENFSPMDMPEMSSEEGNSNKTKNKKELETNTNNESNIPSDVPQMPDKDTQTQQQTSST